MSAADVSRTERTDRHDRNNSVHLQAQCTPRPMPAVGTQRILHGNGTDVGTVISLQCPAKHKLIGSDLKCVMGPNSTHWVGETYCKPLSPYGDYGFRVAVLASIVSSGIIFLMSVAFITCCLLDCMKENNRKEQERDSEMWHWEEQAQKQEQQRSRYGHKGRNNNNNAQQKSLSPLHTDSPSLCDSVPLCRCQPSYVGAPLCSLGQPTLVSPHPGEDYHQPLITPRTEDRGASHGAETVLCAQTASPVQRQSHGSGSVQHYGRQQRSLPGGTQSTEYEPYTGSVHFNRNRNSNEFPIKVISV